MPLARYNVSQKTPHTDFSHNSSQKRTIWIIFGTQNPKEFWHEKFCFYPPHVKMQPLYLENSRYNFSSISYLQYSQLQLDKFSQPEIDYIFLANVNFYCGSHMNSQNDLVYVSNAMKQQNMHHNNHASRISSVETWNECYQSMAMDESI